VILAAQWWSILELPPADALGWRKITVASPQFGLAMHGLDAALRGWRGSSRTTSNLRTSRA